MEASLSGSLQRAFCSCTIEGTGRRIPLSCLLLFYASLMMYEFFELSILLLFSLFLSYIDPSRHLSNDRGCKQLVHSFRDTELTF